MNSNDHRDLSRRERQILDILYQRGQATAAEVQGALDTAWIAVFGNIGGTPPPVQDPAPEGGPIPPIGPGASAIKADSDDAAVSTETATGPVSSSHGGMGAVPYGTGVAFRVWAPTADSVAGAGTFNGWSVAAHPLAQQRGAGGSVVNGGWRSVGVQHGDETVRRSECRR